MMIDANNFDDFTIDEYRDNLIRLGLLSHASLVGELVYYAKKEYGEHVVLEWNAEKSEYLLDLDGQCFWSNPFRIFR